VASRVLPVRIHDLDPEDVKLCESVLGGVLRGIEFIYKEPGVNRPLAQNDDEKNNLSKTKYRNQINKVTNAIREVISGLKSPDLVAEEISKVIYQEKPLDSKIQRKNIFKGALILMVLIVAGYFVINKIVKPKEQLEKTIAVLPFINDSPSDSNAYFINGIMDEILNHLQKIGSFSKVISRTSTEQFRGVGKLSIPKIAKELGVNYIVEGSGQKYGNSYVLRVQLIEGKNDKHIWAETYKKEIKEIEDIYTAQIEIAKSIAAELKAVITPEEKSLIEKLPTENLDAYTLYLHGNESFWQSNNPVELEKAAEMYEKAVKIDPNFALAYARLSICHSRIYSFISTVQTVGNLSRSKSALDSVLKIDPDLPEAHLALGDYYYDIVRDYPKALEEIQKAEKKLPNNSDCAYFTGLIHRRSGSWQLGKENLIRAFELDPGSAVIANATGQTLSRMREFPAAESYLKKAISLNPSLGESYYECAMVYLKWNRDTIKAREILNDFRFKDPENKLYSLQIIRGRILLHDYQKALNDLSKLDNDPKYGYSKFFYSAMLYATIYYITNQPDKANYYFTITRKQLELIIKQAPDRAWQYLSFLGYVNAGLGLKKEAIEAGNKGKEAVLTRDTMDGPGIIERLAKIYVMTGDYSAAIEQIKLSLSVTGGLTTPLLLQDQEYKPLWNLPEFKKIIEKYTSE
jgi:TolB-like protein/Tfp pilus assembly protein PilF